MKKPWMSKTLWVNALLAVWALGIPGAAQHVQLNTELCIAIVSLINIVLRLVTKSQIEVKGKSVACLMAALFVSSCSTPPQVLDPNVLYIRSIDFAVDGTRYSGTAVLPKKSRYDIEIYSYAAMDLVTIRTCAREFYGEKVGVGGGIKFWEKERKFTYTYEPDSELEYARVCPMEIASYDATSGANLWGFVDFDSTAEDYSLPAVWHCNGKVVSYPGVSACQNRTGNKVKIRFPVEVIVSPGGSKPECKWANAAVLKATEFEFSTPQGPCYYTFMETGSERRKHRTTVIGYSDIVIKRGG